MMEAFRFIKKNPHHDDLVQLVKPTPMSHSQVALKTGYI